MPSLHDKILCEIFVYNIQASEKKNEKMIKFNVLYLSEKSRKIIFFPFALLKLFQPITAQLGNFRCRVEKKVYANLVKLP